MHDRIKPVCCEAVSLRINSSLAEYITTDMNLPKKSMAPSLIYLSSTAALKLRKQQAVWNHFHRKNGHNADQ